MFTTVNTKKFPRGILDQVISLTLADGCNGSVHLVRASSNKLQAASLREQAVHSIRPKLVQMQGASLKPQAARFKLQATSVKLHNILPLIKFYKVKGEGLN